MTHERFVIIVDTLSELSKKPNAVKKRERYLNSLSLEEREMADRVGMRAFYLWLRPHLGEDKQKQMMSESIVHLHEMYCGNSGASSRE